MKAFEKVNNKLDKLNKLGIKVGKFLLVTVLAVGTVGTVGTVTFGPSEQDIQKLEITLNKMILERLNREKHIELINGLK